MLPDRFLKRRISLGMALLSLSAGGLAVHSSFDSSLAWGRTPYTDQEVRAVESAEETKIRELREQEVTQLRIALGRRSPANRRADLYFRLAELYLEAYRAEFLLEGRSHEKRLERGEPDKFIDRSRSKPYLNAGIKAAKDILSLGIPFSKMDQVYYFLGFNYGELGDRKESLRNFEIISVRYPDSPFAAEAFRELGDEAFRERQYKEAQNAYLAAIQRAQPDMQPRLYHKLAWSYYRTRQFDRAVESMKQAVALSVKHGDKFVGLREEALRDMALFMTEGGKADEAIRYFSETIGDSTYYPRMLEKLGKQYERNVEPQKATQVYESLIKTRPEDDAAFRATVKLVDLDLRSGRTSEALARLKGAKIPLGAKEDETQIAAQNLKAMIRRTATEHHDKYRKAKEQASLVVAESYYTVYLNLFLSKEDPRKETPEIQMYLAEVKRELGKAKEASTLYRSVVQSKDKRYAKEAGALWTASLSEAIRKSEQTSSAEPSALELEFIDAADRLHEALGDTVEGREAALKAAEVLAGYKSTRKDSLARARKIVSLYPKTPQALTAARLWLQVVNEGDGPEKSAEHLEELKTALSELRENQALMSADQENNKGKLKQQITDQETRLKIGYIAKNERAKDFVAAGKGYEAFAQEAGSRDLAEKAYANAIGSYLKSKDTDAVERVSANWLKRFPKSPKAMDSIRAAGTQFLIQGRFELAAKVFEQLGRDGVDPDSLETAARIYEGNGDPRTAMVARKAYLDIYKNSAHRWLVTLALARSSESQGVDSETVRIYRECMAGPHEFETECGVRLADFFQRMKNPEEHKGLLQKVAAMTPKKKGAALSPFVGYARYRLAEMMEVEARFEPLALPDVQLKKGLEQRLAFFDPLSKAYLSAVDAGGPWAVAALDRLANWAFNFSEEVNRIAPPKTADEKGIADFKRSLAAVSEPLRRKAAQTWSDGYSKALSVEALSPALPRMADSLAAVGASTPSRAQGFRGRFRLAGIPSDGGSDGKVAAIDKVRTRLVQNPGDAAAWVDYGNLLWGTGRPVLARLAYDHALSLNPRNAAALNNRAVLLLNADGGEEDWSSAAEGNALLQAALKEEEFLLSAKINRALLLNYYRLFSKSRPLWEQIIVKSRIPDAYDGLGVTLQGLGDPIAAEKEFKKATDQGSGTERFAALYHEAARAASAGASSAEKCLSLLGDLKSNDLQGFEKEAVERLRATCTQWKNEK